MLSVVLRGAALSMTIRVSGIGLMFLAHAMLARSLGPNQYGIFLFAISNVIPLVAMISMLGMQHTSLKYLPEYSAAGKTSLELGYVFKSLQFAIVGSATLAVFGRYITSAVDLPPVIEPALRSALWIALGFSAIQVIQQAFRAKKRIVLSQAIEQIGLPLLLIVAGAIQLVDVASYGYQELFAGVGTYYILAAIIAGFVLIRSIGGERQYVRARYSTREWLINALPACVVGVTTILASRMDILVLGWHVDPEQIAIYGVASRIGGLMIVIFAATNAMAGPMMSELYSCGKFKEMTALFRKVTLISVAFTGITLLLLVVAGEYALLLFGGEYISAWNILVILAAGQMVNLAAGGPTYFLLIIMGKSRQHMYIVASATAILFVALVAVIPIYGTIGAAIATTTTIILSNAALLFAIHQNLKTLTDSVPA